MIKIVYPESIIKKHAGNPLFGWIVLYNMFFQCIVKR